MKHFAALLTVLLLSGRMLAQQFPRAEVFGGYQYTAVDASTLQQNLNAVIQGNPSLTTTVAGHFNANGWNAAGQANVKRWVGAIFDFSGSYSTQTVSLPSVSGLRLAVPATSQFYTFMAGPQLTYRKSLRFQPFARGLVGGVTARVRGNLTSNGVKTLAQDVQSDETGIGYGGGGGFDIRLVRNFYLRAAGDYIRSTLFGFTQNNFRASTGVVYRTGEAETTAPHKPPAAITPQVQEGEITIAALGISGVNEANGGFRITGISPGGPASQSTMKVGDIIVGINGKPSKRAEDITAAIAAYQPGTKVDLSYIRGYWQSETSVVLK